MATRQYFAVLTLIMLFLVSFSCSKKVDCPAFNSFELIPSSYVEGSEVIFKNQENNIKKYEIVEIILSENYSFDCKDLNKICFCESYATIFVSNENDKLFEFLKIELNDNNNQQVYRYTIMDFNFEFDFVNDLPNLHYFDNIDLVEEFEIDNEQYHQVVVLHNNDSESTSIVDKVYFNKEYGILKIVEKANNIAWTAVL